MERVIGEGDRATVLSAAETVIKVTSRHKITPEGQKYLDDLTNKAIKFAQGDPLILARWGPARTEK
jgi:hypothetical protein